MRTVLGLVAALTLVFVVARPALAADAHIDPVRLEAFVDGAIRQSMRDQHVAGMAVAVIDKNGPLLLKGYGNAGRGRTVNADTLFRVGSISKTFTWIAIMQLVEQGKIKLDDPINAHLPQDLQIPDEGFTDPILIRHLMTHSAGFEDSTLGANVTLDLDRVSNLHDYLKNHRVHRVRPPGQLIVYSNYGAALAGVIVEHEARMPFVEYAEEHILRPLGMQTATFREPYPEDFVGRGLPNPMSKSVHALASTGFRYKNGDYVEQSWDYLPMMAPAGALSASAREMALYMGALLVPQRLEAAHVLKASTALEMRKPLMKNDPRLGGNRHGFWDVPTPSGEFAFGHNGGMAFHETSMTIMPDSGLAIFVAMNTASLSFNAPPAVTTIPTRIMDEFLGAHAAHRVATTKDESEENGGCYRPLRRPYYRTERALYSFGAIACITAMDNGDLLLANERWLPIGNGVYALRDLSSKVAFGDRAGARVLYNYDSSGPSERVRFFETPNWFNLWAVLAALAAFWRTGSLISQAISGRNAEMMVTDATGVVWLVALGLTAAVASTWLADLTDVLLYYPGTLFPLACWLLLIAALATVAALLYMIVVRPQDWPWSRWLGIGTTYGTFLVFSATLLHIGFLGFSGW